MPRKKLYSEQQSFDQMIQWLKSFSPLNDRYNFGFVFIEENGNIEKEFLQQKFLHSYRDELFYKMRFQKADRATIVQYVENNVIPGNKNQIEKNVRLGDFGEIVVALIAKYFYDEISFPKLKFKLNNERSAFATDVISFDDINNPTTITFFESKVKTPLLKKITVEKKSVKMNRMPPQYISVIAYESLQNDFTCATQPMLDFMAQRYVEEKKYDLAQKYMDLSDKYRTLNCKYEIFIFTEKTNPLPNYKKILKDLDALNLQLQPLKVTLVFIENLNNLIEDVWNGCAQRAVDLYEK